ncbi:MAG: aspartate ammonia-lyase [Candidatus Riflebacteria bacterium]|nr:aspartate ammonia-lyase [Candidatus Riflebacteria bacterium]
MKDKLASTLVGVAGEYLVAGELSLRGYIASITLRNSRGIDIIASNADATRSVSVQVKTNSYGSDKWILNQKAEKFHSDNHYYIFVSLKDPGERPDYYIVPSIVVANYVSSSHSEWLKGVKSDGTPRKDSGIRNFKDQQKEFLEAWNLIKL